MNATVILWVYIAFLIAGGLMGFIKAGSKASLIASSVLSIPLILCALGYFNLDVAKGFLMFLTVFFGLRFAKGKKFMPMGMMAILSLVALALLFFGTTPKV